MESWLSEKLMQTFILILGTWTTVEGLLGLLIPNVMRQLGRWVFRSSDELLTTISNQDLRKLALMELLFGIWMLILFRWRNGV